VFKARLLSMKAILAKNVKTNKNNHDYQVKEDWKTLVGRCWKLLQRFVNPFFSDPVPQLRDEVNQTTLILI